jgi:hypothetical protein
VSRSYSSQGVPSGFTPAAQPWYTSTGRFTASYTVCVVLGCGSTPAAVARPVVCSVTLPTAS